MKKLIALTVIVCAAGMALADVALLSTHDAGAALKAARANGQAVNPYTDAAGGVWSFGRANREGGGGGWIRPHSRR